MNEKIKARQRRAKRTRAHIKKLGVPRLAVYRSAQHIYAQVFNAAGDQVLASAATTQKSVREALDGTGNMTAAAAVGKAVAAKALEAGVDTVAFDRSGYAYHGRVKALAEAAREGGLKF